MDVCVEWVVGGRGSGLGDGVASRGLLLARRKYLGYRFFNNILEIWEVWPSFCPCIVTALGTSILVGGAVERRVAWRKKLPLLLYSFRPMLKVEIGRWVGR